MPAATEVITPIHTLEAKLQPFYARLADHPLYRSIHSLEDLHRFMQTHVFAVWDLMSLLKALQRGLTSVNLPRLPSAQSVARRLINEIVLGEESDLYDGQPLSHFELYLRAMHDAGASTIAIDAFISSLRHGTSVTEALGSPAIPAAARTFVQSTFAVIEHG